MNEKLRQDVELLKGKRIIKKDKDIIANTGVNKAALSSYLSGRVKASKNFLDKFYGVYKMELDDKLNEPEVPYQRKGNIIAVPLHAYGGFLQGYKNIVYMDSLERFTLPDVHGEHYAFEVQGVSMIDFASPGDWAISRWEEHPDYMAKGKPYVLQTIDGILIKFFDRFEGKDEKKRAWFTSKNKEYEPISIPVKELKKIYFVNRILKKI